MRATVVAVVLLVTLASAPIALAQQEEGTVAGRPRIELSAPDNRVSGGEEVQLDVFVANGGDVDRGGPPALEERVKTARNVRLEIAEDRLDDEVAAAVEVNTGSVVLGSVSEGLGGPATFSLSVNESLAPGTYEIPIRVAYDYEGIIEYRGTTPTTVIDFSQRVTRTVTLVVTDQARFELSPASTEVVTAGDARAYGLTVTNVGNRTATDVAVTLRTGNSSLFIGNRSSPRQVTTTVIDRLPPGASRTVTVRVGANERTPPGVVALGATVEYTTPGGVDARSGPFVVGVPVGAGRTFALQNVTASLRPGESGVVRGEVVNTGQSPVAAGTVVVRSESPNLAPREERLPVGELRPGEAVPFAVRVDVSNRTEPGAKRFTFRVRYRDEERDAHESDPLEASVDVGAEQSFAVADLDDTLQVGERGVVKGRVVNTGGETVTDVVVLLESARPTLAPRETMVAIGTLRPNESATFSFPLDVAPEAEPGSRPVGFRVRYRGGDGEVRTSDAVDATVSVAPEQSFAIRETSDTLRVGGSGTVRGTVVNTGPASVSNVVLVLASANGTLSPRATEFAVGTIAPGESRPFSFRLDAGNRTEPGPRELSIRVRYRGQEDVVRTTDPIPLAVTVGPELTFAVRNVSDSLRVGETGTVRGTVVNTGNRTVENATVVVASPSPVLGPRETEYPVGTLAPGEAVAFAFEVDVRNRTDAGPRRVEFRVRYRDESGEVQTSDAVDASVSVAPEQSFAVRDVSDDLRVGESGTVRGTVVNTGDESVSGVVVVLESDGSGLRPRTTEYAVGTLGPGGAAGFAFEVDASNRTSAGPRPVAVRVRYRDSRGDLGLSDPLDARVDVAPASDEYLVEPLDATVEVDGRTVLAVRVTNQRDETFTDVRAELSVSDPFETDDPTSFVQRLEPGNSTEVRFDLSATDDAIPKTDSVAVTLTYTDENGERIESGPYFVAVTVVRPESEFPIVPAVAVVVAIAAAGVWWWRRRQ